MILVLFYSIYLVYGYSIRIITVLFIDTKLQIYSHTHYTELVSRLTVVSREAKEEVPCDGLSTNAREYFTRTNLVKIKNAITDKPFTLALHYSS